MKKKDKLSMSSAIIYYVKSKPHIYKHFDYTYQKQEIDLVNALPIIVNVIKYALPWRSIEHYYWNSIYKIYKRLLSFNVLKETYKELLIKYYKKTPAKKLKMRFTDTTSICNKYGSDLVDYNGHKKRNVTKLSLITDSNGIPLSYKIALGSTYDSTIFSEHINLEPLIDSQLDAKHRKYFLADSEYDTKQILERLRQMNYIPIIAYNKRNTKDCKKMRYFNKVEKNIYKHRLKIEHMNGFIKTHRRVNVRYDRNIDTFEGSINLAFIDAILKHI